MVAFSYFLIAGLGSGKSLFVSALYSKKPSFLDCRLSAIGMLTNINRQVLASAPIKTSQGRESAIKTENAIPHHIKISPR